jgi:hypothetical protein
MKILRLTLKTAALFGRSAVPHSVLMAPIPGDLTTGTRVDGRVVEMTFSTLYDSICVQWGAEQFEMVPMSNVAGVMCERVPVSIAAKRSDVENALEAVGVDPYGKVDVAAFKAPLDAAFAPVPKKRGRPKKERKSIPG